MSSAGDEWPSGGYGLPRPKSGCPGGKKDGWYVGWRFQDMEDADKNTSGRSRASNGTHMDVEFTWTPWTKRDVNRTFCMKRNTGTQTSYWPKGKVSSLYARTDYLWDFGDAFIRCDRGFNSRCGHTILM